MFAGMGVNARKSEDYLHTDVILSKITEYDIFRHYCPVFTKGGKKFKSELRVDNSPTVSIVLWKGYLLYKDFGHPEHTFNCFGYVMYKYSLGFLEALRVISNDFNLGLTSTESITSTVAKTFGSIEDVIEEQKQARIQIRKRAWGTKDKDFWKQFCISKKLLLKFGVSPLQYFWINETRFKCNTISYVYDFNESFKIYCPLERDHKWYSNTNKKCIQGYSQLPQSGEVVFLTSSLKDVMCLEMLGCQSIALQSEMQMPEKVLIEDLKARFKWVIVLYDNDFESDTNPGQMMARKICDEYTLINICIPTELRSKDISDLVKDYGVEMANNFIKNNLPHDVTILHKPKY
tara:strand:- start:81 stop:1121 length:1041 start_codon:yes stop_codon:yes gene_type:complete